MTLSELIREIGDENVTFQNLDRAATSLDWSAKKGLRITFMTDQPFIPDKGTKELGLVVWLDREAVAKAGASEDRDDPAPDAPDELEAALNRAGDLINVMAEYIGKMALSADDLAALNQHWVFMERRNRNQGKSHD